MASFNRIILMGNLTRDPELKQLASGQAVCRLGLASNRQFKNKQSGQMTQEVCFVDVDVWGIQAESCSQYLSKGRPVLIEGRLKLDSWQEADGTKRSKHSIVADRVTFLSGAAQEDGLDNYDAAPTAGQTIAEPVEEPKRAFRAKPATTATTESTSAKTTASTSRSTKKLDQDLVSDDAFGEIDLKSSEPFEDDLPF